MNLDFFLISERAPLRDALVKIEFNKHGIVLATRDDAVVGLATDGDIRRRLLQGASLDDPISTCVNPDFVWADDVTPRELLLKQLDHRIRVIPLIDSRRRLTGIVGRHHLPVPGEAQTYARARAPVRVSFGGGGSDLTHYFAGETGAVINATVSLFTHATLRVRADERILVRSRDLGGAMEADNLHGAMTSNPQFGLIQALLKCIQPEFGFELFIESDFPLKSGLGGSAAVSAAVLGCFNQFRNDRWDLHELAELAFQAERLYLGVSGGWQDQYAAVFGGFNFMEFRMSQNIVHPLRVPPDVMLELQESLVLCDTGAPHDSGDIHDHQRVRMQQDEVKKKVQSNVEVTYRIRDHLLRGQLYQLGLCLNEAWQYKRQFSEKISSPVIDRTYATALQSGAIGGKLLGAGGGGFFLFYVPPFQKHELLDKLESLGLQIHPFHFEQEGLRAWSTREGKSGARAVAP